MPTSPSSNASFPPNIKALIDSPGVKEALAQVPALYKQEAIEPLVQHFRRMRVPCPLNSAAMYRDMVECMTALSGNNMKYFTDRPFMWDHAQAGLTKTIDHLSATLRPTLNALNVFLQSNVISDDDPRSKEMARKETERRENARADAQDSLFETSTTAGGPAKTTTTGPRSLPVAGEYKLYIALSNSKFPKTPAKKSESWQSEVKNNFLPELCGYSDLPALKGIGGIIYHTPSGRDVGYLEGAQITRRGEWFTDCDDASQELSDIFSTLFDMDDGKLQHEYRGVWGKSLDKGKLMTIENMEIVPEHRGKNALASIAKELVEFMTSKGITGLIMAPGSKNRPAIKGKPTDGGSFEEDKQPEGLGPRVHKKLVENYAKQLGCLRMGETDYVAMIPDVSHRCWDVATHHTAAVTSATTQTKRSKRGRE